MKDYYSPDYLKSKESLICPVCGKKFKPSEDTNCIASGGYTCSWKCFAAVAKKISREKNAEGKKNRRVNNKT